MNKLKSPLNKIDRNILSGGCLLLAGILFFASGALLTTLVRIAGAIIITVAVLRFIRLAKLYEKGFYLTLSLFNVALLFLLGAVMAILPGGTLHIIFASIGIYMMINAIIRACKIATAPRRTSDFSWWGAVILTAAVFLLGFWLVLSPAEATRLTEIIAGIALIVKGVETLSSSITSEKRRTKKKSDDIETDFVDKSDK